MITKAAALITRPSPRSPSTAAVPGTDLRPSLGTQQRALVGEFLSQDVVLLAENGVEPIQHELWQLQQPSVRMLVSVQKIFFVHMWMRVGLTAVMMFVLVFYVLVIMEKMCVHMLHLAMTVLVAVWFVHHYIAPFLRLAMAARSAGHVTLSQR